MTSSPTSPGVSVVIATRNRPELLAKAVAAALAQDYDGPIEVIAVFDQAEPVMELEQAGDHRSVRVTRNVCTPGLPGARNTGMALAPARAPSCTTRTSCATASPRPTRRRTSSRRP